MSQQPPPPPYGGPPGPPPSGMSNKAKFWLGVVLAIPALIVGPLIVGLAVNLGQVISADGPVSGILGGLASVLLLAGFVAVIVLERSRWVGLGMLAGIAILLIVGAGACIVLLAGLSNA